MPPKKDAALELAENMVRVLQVQRSLGPDSYPLPVRRLAELTDPQASDALVLKALAKKQFTQQVALGQKKNLHAPVALQEDRTRLVASPLFLEFLLEPLGIPPYPGWPLTRLKMDAPLKKVLPEVIETNALPESVGVNIVKNKPHLFLKRMAPAPPPPPPKKPEVELAEKMVRLLETERGRGPSSYPTTLRHLLELADARPFPTLATKALKVKVFAERVVIAQNNKEGAPVALIEDLEQLAGSALLLDAALQAARTPQQEAFSVAELKKKVVARLQGPFAAAVERQLENQALPASVGWLLVKKKLLFRMEDVHCGKEPSKLVAAPPTDFAAAFEEAFERLDRQAGSSNFVSLVELRRALPLDRAAFDAELRQLRLARRFTLSAAEGRHGIRPEERDAGITEEGALLLFVSKRLP